MTFTLYTKADCSLCDTAKDALADFRRECVFELQIIDITAHATLFEKYKHDIPVLAIDGEDVVKHFIDLKKLRVLTERHRHRPR